MSALLCVALDTSRAPTMQPSSLCSPSCHAATDRRPPVPTDCRATEKIGSSYYYDVLDASGTAVAGMTNLLATISDVTQDSLTFTTAVIPDANQRYSVVVKACTGQGTKCSAGTESNPEGVGESSQEGVNR